mmetsp:Transcript_22468/g.42409  ORF Transcript_22468/g.42409 Transcript_22468/m.42409 type:complete len:219 (+) Transcript_22468:205-861(+)
MARTGSSSNMYTTATEKLCLAMFYVTSCSQQWTGVGANTFLQHWRGGFSSAWLRDSHPAGRRGTPNHSTSCEHHGHPSKWSSGCCLRGCTTQSVCRTFISSEARGGLHFVSWKSSEMCESSCSMLPWLRPWWPVRSRLRGLCRYSDQSRSAPDSAEAVSTGLSQPAGPGWFEICAGGGHGVRRRWFCLEDVAPALVSQLSHPWHLHVRAKIALELCGA